MSDHFWGIDLGGPKIEGVVLPTATSSEPLSRLRLPTERDRGYEHVRRQIVHLVDQLADAVGERPTRLGIGTPGVLDPKTRQLKNSNTTCLIGQPLQSDLESELNVEIDLANDANCFALAEARLGAGRGADWVGQRLLSGRHHIAGEWGHNVMEPGGRQCYCGLRGCVETLLAGPHLEARYREATGRSVSLSEIATAAIEDTDAAAVIDHLCEWFARCVASVINILDPEVVVLGGGVSNVEALYTRGIETLRQWVFNDELHTRIARNELGDSAGVFGAAMLTAPDRSEQA